MTRLVTLITGASAGIGAEFARLCGARGDALALAARRRDRLEALAGEIGGESHVFTVDLARADAAASLIGEIEAEGLAVDLLINNAGFGAGGRFAALGLERQREMIAVNVAALTELTHLVLPGMIERGRGAILNVASTAGFQPGPGAAVYFASKAYVLSLTEALHQELKGSGIAVSALCPGPTDSEFFEVAGYDRAGDDRAARKAARAGARGVAEAGLDGLSRNRAVVVPGLSNKATAQANRFLPRAAMRAIVAKMRL
jgi:short-subunit dehydrogenase